MQALRLRQAFGHLAMLALELSPRQRIGDAREQEVAAFALAHELHGAVAKRPYRGVDVHVPAHHDDGRAGAMLRYPAQQVEPRGIRQADVQQGEIDLLGLEQPHAGGHRLRFEDQAIGAAQQAPRAGSKSGLVVDDQDPVDPSHVASGGRNRIVEELFHQAVLCDSGRRMVKVVPRPG